MSRPEHQVRRATVNDLAQLRGIWDLERLPAADLEKRFTEFQVVETLDGKIIGAIGLQIQGNQGRIHSESIGAPEHSEWLRPVLWERLQGVARNHGLVRLWADEAQPHWRTRGFQEPAAEIAAKLPAEFGGDKFLFLQLREEVTPAFSIEHELNAFRDSQKVDLAKFQEQARTMKTVALVISLVVFVLAMALIFYAYKARIAKEQGGLPSGPPPVQSPAAPPKR